MKARCGGATAYVPPDSWACASRRLGIPQTPNRLCGLHAPIVCNRRVLLKEELCADGDGVCGARDRVADGLGRLVDLVVVAALVRLVAAKVDLAEPRLDRWLGARTQQVKMCRSSIIQ
eukprot:588218-Pleurochrysis_carterae.AAC.2